MATLNIGRDQSDKSYRYKMPRLLTKVEGRGNGIKTVLPNILDIAKALHTDPGYPTKYFGIELGAMSKFDQKREVGIVNGKHEAPDLAKLLEGFIETFVLCPTCKLPEINMKVNKKKDIVIDCRACGHNGVLKTAHKLTTFIINNPPGSAAKGGSAGKDKKGKKGGDDNDHSSGDEPSPEESKVQSELLNFKNTAKNRLENDEVAAAADAASKKAKKGQLAAAGGADEEEVEWFTDTSKEAAELRQAAEIEEMKRSAAAAKGVEAILAAAAAKEKAGTERESPVVSLKAFLASPVERSEAEILSELKILQLARSLDEVQKVHLLVQALFDTSKPKTLPAQVKKHASILKHFGSTPESARRLIGGFEELAGVIEPACLPVMSHVIKALYDLDIVEEEAVLAWFETPEAMWLWNVNRDRAGDFRKQVKIIYDWLKSASDDEDEDGDDN